MKQSIQQTQNTLPYRECVFLGLGSNQGDRTAFLNFAIHELGKQQFRVCRISTFIETEPVDCVADAGMFLNGVVCGQWDGVPEELLAVTQKIERMAGRPMEHSSRESRNLDIDILLFKDHIFQSPKLIIPHPRAQLRNFVLEPLYEIAPDLIFPDTQCCVSDLLAKLHTGN